MIYTSGRHSGRGLWIRVVLPVLCMAGLLFGVAAAFRLLADAVMVNLYYDAWLWICLGSVCTAFLALALACKESAYKRKTAAEASELLAFMKTRNRTGSGGWRRQTPAISGPCFRMHTHGAWMTSGFRNSRLWKCLSRNGIRAG